MLTFCCVTLSTVVRPRRPAESLPADSLPTSSPSGRLPLRVLPSRGALATPRHGPARAPPPLLLACQPTQTSTFFGRDPIMLMKEFFARFSGKDEGSFLFEILHRVSRLDPSALQASTTDPSQSPPGWGPEWPAVSNDTVPALRAALA